MLIMSVSEMGQNESVCLSLCEGVGSKAWSLITGIVMIRICYLFL